MSELHLAVQRAERQLCAVCASDGSAYAVLRPLGDGWRGSLYSDRALALRRQPMTTGNHFDDAMRQIARASRGAKGCTPDECETVRKLQGVEHLPEQYSAFLRTMGAETGELYWSYGMGLPVLRAALRVAETCCAETGFSLPPQAVILGSHDGYQFFYLDPATGAVKVYSESMDPRGYEVTDLAASLVEFLIEYAEVPPA